MKISFKLTVNTKLTELCFCLVELLGQTHQPPFRANRCEAVECATFRLTVPQSVRILESNASVRVNDIMTRIEAQLVPGTDRGSPQVFCSRLIR